MSLPKDAIQAIGYQLSKLQFGEDPDDFAPIPQVGKGAYEIRICMDEHYRAFYVAKFDDRIHVLHVFHKKSKKGIGTPRQDMAKGKKYYGEAQKDVEAKQVAERKRKRNGHH